MIGMDMVMVRVETWAGMRAVGMVRGPTQAMVGVRTRRGALTQQSRTHTVILTLTHNLAAQIATGTHISTHITIHISTHISIRVVGPPVLQGWAARARLQTQQGSIRQAQGAVRGIVKARAQQGMEVRGCTRRRTGVCRGGHRQRYSRPLRAGHNGLSSTRLLQGRGTVYVRARASQNSKVQPRVQTAACLAHSVPCTQDKQQWVAQQEMGVEVMMGTL